MTGITLPANLNIYVSAALFVLGAYLFALYVGLVVWTFRDIRSRSRDVLAHILSALLVVVLTIPGWLVYLLLRPHTTLAEEYDRNLAEEAMLQDLEERRICPGCRRRVDTDFVVCPSCHRALRSRCTACGRLLNLNWDVCPYCSLPREKATDSKDKAEEAPVTQEATLAVSPQPAPASATEQSESTPNAPVQSPAGSQET
jgi:RNA polymerase subunit RPABC4/transcription elongation factor Spt4